MKHAGERAFQAESYLERMGVKDAGDIAREIVNYIKNNTEDDYYAIKYGRRMITALVEAECNKNKARSDIVLQAAEFWMCLHCRRRNYGRDLKCSRCEKDREQKHDN